MELIIQEIIQKIISCFEIELEKLIMERRDISEFILATKNVLDEVGTIIVANALEKADEIIRNSKTRKQAWTIKETAVKRPMEPYLGKSGMREHTIKTKEQVNTAICQMRL